MGKFSLPSLKAIKLPFGKGESSLHDPIEDDDTSDPFDYDAPSKFQKMLPWLMVAGAYFLTVAGVAGTYLYLDSQAEQIEQELIDQRPSNLIEEIKISKSTDNTEPEATEASENVSGEEDDKAENANPDAMAENASTEDTVTSNDAATAEPAVRDYGKMMLPHPDPSLIEESKEGPLPKIADDGREPWRVYSRPFNSFENRPKVALVMVDLGISRKATTEALERLPGEVTFAFAPYTPQLPSWIAKARDTGHEVMLTLPMEPIDFPKSDPGPYALYTNLEAAQNTKKLNWIMSRGTGYVGLISYQGSKYLSSESHVRLLAARMKARGLLYMDSFYSPVNAAPKMMELTAVPYITMDEIVDTPPGRTDVSRKLKMIEEIALQKGVAVAIAHPYSATIKQIERWAEGLDEKGLALVPVTSVAIEGLQK
ncbi:divergent polysaccharide deacetylase family protein [Curvivirga sp.]|uniref:divergent polysaccharide deacetylase family protein n=1 Tax=Curvivirga sp. TaxID=2856848 RepID=UPI003B5CF4A1